MLSMSMSIFGCDSCNQSPKEAEQPGTIELIASPDIDGDGDGVGEITLKIKGGERYSDILLFY